MDIVCFPGVLFDKVPWTNRQRIMLELAKRHRVFYVEPPKLPILQMCKAIARVMPEQRPVRWFGRLARPEKRAQDLWVLSQLACVPERWPAGRRLNATVNAPRVLRQLESLRVTDPLAWAYTPDAVTTIDRLGLERIVFDVVDDYPAQPYYRDHMHGVEGDQLRLARKASVIFTSAQKLQRQFSTLNPRCHFTGNAADFDHFSKAFGEADVPQDLRGLNRPRVGFVGALDDYKVDADLLEAVAAMRPAWHFILIGSAVVGDRLRTSSLEALSNVHMLGSRPHAQLPAYLSGMDACIIPYRLNRYTESCLPLKFFEFLGAGKPVVSTPLPELLPYSSVVRLAGTPDAFVREIAASLYEDSPRLRDARLAFAREHTWDAKAQRMERLIEELGI